MTEEKITLCANAKLNLFLDIAGRRADGMHELETLMQSVDLCDVVTVEKRRTDGKITVGCSDPSVPRDEGNICHKAAELYMRLAGRRFGVNVHIEKRIPHGAGMGGGSADAAAVLAGLNELEGGAVPAEELSARCAEIGADVPFCLAGGRRFCGGIGEQLGENLAPEKRTFLVVKPDFRVSTAEAYAMYDKNPVSRKEYAEGRFYNVFEEIYQNAEIRKIKQTLAENGAEDACLTGSGSAVFGAFRGAREARSAARAFPGYFTAVCAAAERGVIVVEK